MALLEIESEFILASACQSCLPQDSTGYTPGPQARARAFIVDERKFVPYLSLDFSFFK